MTPLHHDILPFNVGFLYDSWFYSGKQRLHFTRQNILLSQANHFISSNYDERYRVPCKQTALRNIFCMYILKKNTRNGILALSLLNALALLLYDIQVFSLLALPIILLYKGGYLKIERRTKEHFWKEEVFA